MRWLIWEQRDDGRYGYDIVDTREEAREIAEKSSTLFFAPAGVKWKKGQLINRMKGAIS